MRTNLKVNFAEKDKVKALGARWDPKVKVWYIENVPDLARFAAWIPELADYQQQKGAEKKATGEIKSLTNQRGKAVFMVSGTLAVHSACDCDVLPWEHCEHTTSS